jgi:hypothetical protein
MIGDRLDTDMAGAHAAGMPSLAVLTGVSGPADMLCAVESQRPTYIGADLRALHGEVDAVLIEAGPPWRVSADGAGLMLESDGSPGPNDEVAALRSLCAVHWAGGGGVVDVRAGDDIAAAALRSLGLTAG